jgi:hypothetical protein
MQQCRCFIAPCVRAHEAFWRRLCASTYISHSFCHMKRAQIPQSTARDCAHMCSSYMYLLCCACLPLCLALLARDVSRFARFHILILSVEVRYG